MNYAESDQQQLEATNAAGLWPQKQPQTLVGTKAKPGILKNKNSRPRSSNPSRPVSQPVVVTKSSERSGGREPPVQFQNKGI